MGELVDEFQNKFKKEEIKQEWYSLQTSYKREKSRKGVQKASRVGCAVVYYSNWEHYNQMDFLDITTRVDDSYTSEPYIPPMRKEQEKKEEKNAKLEVWKSSAECLKSHKP